MLVNDRVSFLELDGADGCTVSCKSLVNHRTVRFKMVNLWYMNYISKKKKYGKRKCFPTHVMRPASHRDGLLDTSTWLYHRPSYGTLSLLCRCFADVIKVHHQLTLLKGDYPGCSG